MLITPAMAQAATSTETSLLLQFLPFVLIFVIMYFLIIRPQQRRVREHQEMVKNLRRGDQVVTSGGMIAKITRVLDDNEVEVEVSEGVKVRMIRQTISEVRSKSEPVSDSDDSSEGSSKKPAPRAAKKPASKK